MQSFTLGVLVAQYDPKKRSYKDNTKFDSAFLSTTLSYAMWFLSKQEGIESVKHLGEFDQDFQKCWIYCVWCLLIMEWCKKNKKKQTMKISCVCFFRYNSSTFHLTGTYA